MPYSTQFAAAILPGGSTSAYTVPASYRAVIRDIRVFNGDGSTQSVNAQTEVPGPSTILFYRNAALASLATDSWEGRLVMNSGDVLLLYSDLGSVAWTVSGYLLSAP